MGINKIGNKRGWIYTTINATFLKLYTFCFVTVQLSIRILSLLETSRMMSAWFLVAAIIAPILGMLFMMPTKLLHKRCHEYGYGASWLPVGGIVRDLQASVSQPCQLLLPEVLLYILASGYFSAVNVIVLVYQRAEYIGRYGVRLWYKQTGFTSHLRNTVFTFYFCFVKICWIKAVSRTRGPCA